MIRHCDRCTLWEGPCLLRGKLPRIRRGPKAVRSRLQYSSAAPQVLLEGEAFNLGCRLGGRIRRRCLNITHLRRE